MPVIFLSFILLILTAVELFVFVREGIQIANSRYYPNLSILSVLQGWSFITIGSCVLVLTCYVVSFIVSYNLISPYNYGMFWKPHFYEKGGWFK